jgi:2'-5' RNA ligase
VVGGERIRLFCALRLPEATLDELERWQRRHLLPERAPGGRLVPRENLHVTLAFLGSRPAGDAPVAARELAAAAGSLTAPLRLAPARYRETRSVGMVVLDDAGGAAGALADDLRRRLEALDLLRPERRPWLPHVTVLRFRERPRLRPPLPALGEVSPSDAAVYSSVLRPGGAQYAVLEALALRVSG